MNASKRQIMGCLVTDSQTGEPIGRVESLVFDAQGDAVTEIVVAKAQRPESPEDELEERLLGRLLFDRAERYMGEITDALLGSLTGELRGLITERSPGRQELVEVAHGLRWEDEHWVLLQAKRPLRSTLFPAETPEVCESSAAADDWMVGQMSTVRLIDKRGHVIVEVGQRITPGIVEQASRSGVLHKLEAEFSIEGNA